MKMDKRESASDVLGWGRGTSPMASRSSCCNGSEAEIWNLFGIPSGDATRERQQSLAFPSLPWRLLLVTFACFQIIVASGIVYGWASVAGSLLVAPFDKGGASLTLDQTASIFSVAASVSFISSLFLGFILDHFGPRTCSVLSHIIVGLGCFVFASASSYSGFLVGASLVAFGGPGVPSSVVNFANLFPSHRFLAMTCVTGSTTVSFGVLAIFDLLWVLYDIGFRSLFGWYTMVIVVSAFGALLLWPDTPYDFREEELRQPAPAREEIVTSLVGHDHLIEQPLDSALRINEQQQLDRHGSFLLSQKALESGNETAMKNMSLKDLPFLSQLASGCYWRVTILFVVFSFFANLYVASITIELEDLQVYSEDEQHYLTRLLTIIMSLGVLASPPIGWLMDIIGWESCTILTILVEQLHMLVLVFFISREIMLIVGFLVYTLFRQLLFPSFLAGLTDRLGFKYFGILSGLGCAMSGVVQLLMSPLVRLVRGTCHLEVMNRTSFSAKECTHGKWQELHIFQFCVFCLLIQVPLLDYRAKSLREMKAKSALGIDTPIRHVSMASYGAVER